jgi:acyl dehydratase
MATGFDAARDHRFAPTRWFEDFALGERFYIPSRTQTDALFAAFQLASGDNDPIHYDVEYCRRRGHPGMLAHGMQVMIQTAAGAGVFPQLVADSLVALLECSATLVAPVYGGDTLYPSLEIVELIPQRTTGVMVMRATVHNQSNALVLEGRQRYLLRKRPAP